MSKRIYSIIERSTGTVRYVKADNRSQALRHVAESSYRAGVASAMEIADAVERGEFRLETAGAMPEGETE
jgi:hypothetical protein